MLSNDDLRSELETLSQQARQLARDVRRHGDLPARTLASALVDAGKLSERLAKLRRQLHAGNGREE